MSLPDINRTPNTTNSISSLIDGPSNPSHHYENNLETISYRNIDTHPDRLNYPAYLRTANNNAYHVDLSSLTPLNLRYMTKSGQKNNLQPIPPKNQPTIYPPMTPTGDEVKGHLPWSYTNAPTKALTTNQVAPRRVNAEYHVYSPPSIPAPDYDHLD